MSHPATSTAAPQDQGDGWFELDAASPLAVPLYDVAAIRRIENAAFARLPSFTLMSRAGGVSASTCAIVPLRSSSPRPVMTEVGTIGAPANALSRRRCRTAFTAAASSATRSALDNATTARRTPK